MEMFGKIACFVLLCMVVVAPHAEALSCGQVTSGLAPCLPYLQGRGPIEGVVVVLRVYWVQPRPQRIERQHALASNQPLVLLKALMWAKPLDPVRLMKVQFFKA
ncbi:hypothetical protein H5410_052809 [Solanum commersonii]|uniref:Uncharacterized protein n=1 Tax=Solanum commersonii TaxID=4109 RepID=A0A9J5X4N7_SOLCO|nr:hypothetical protein H5410_052809 [Solanum commersonii]